MKNCILCLFFKLSLLGSQIGNTQVKSIFRNLYKKFTRNYSIVSNEYDSYFGEIEKNKEKSKYSCKYLKYWFYDQAIANNINESDIDFFPSLWSNLVRSLPGIRDFPCEFYSLKLDEIKEIKQLYDYFALYDGYPDEALRNFKIYDSVHCKYFKEAIDFYKRMKSRCPNNESSEYCKEFHEYSKDSKFEKALLSFRGICKHKTLNTTPGGGDETKVTLDQDLQKLADGDNFLNDILLSQFYEVLNIGFNNYEESHICNNLIKDSNSYHITKICNKLNAILEKWDQILKPSESVINSKYCEYLNYWIHDQINDKLFRKKTTTLIYTAWDILNKYKITSKNNCWHKNFNVPEKDFKNKKKIFEFLEYYNVIKSKMEKIDTLKKEEYCEYLKSIFSLYYTVKHEDLCKKSTVYKDEVDYFQKTIKDGDLAFLKKNCPGKNIELLFKKEQSSPGKGNQNPQLTKGKQGDELNSLSSETNSNDLDNVEGIDNYCGICINMLKLEKDYPGINELCKTFAKNLSKIKDKGDYNDYCLDLTYWTYDKLSGMLNSTSDYSDLGPVVMELRRVMDHINNTQLKNKSCYFYFDGNRTDRNEEVQLLKYFRNFDSIYAKEYFENGEKEKHCSNAKSINTLYEKYAYSCCTYFKDYAPFNRCRNYFKCDPKYNPYNLQSELNCPGVFKTESTLAKVEVLVPVDNSVNSVKEEPPKIEYFPKVIESNYMELIEDPFYMASSSVFFLIGIFFVFFVFYKFTPIGTWINRKGKKIRHIQNDYNDSQRGKLIMYDSRPEHINYQNERIRLSYHHA
ncbi:PIR protein [Plasmodium vivax]|uniref:VIR protein n=1 Tax=Plasmodium vivax TaxID=5855 RepID=A0A564ZQA8_PLAVI|nr:PIR protein [Plasmodium vivax]